MSEAREHWRSLEDRAGAPRAADEFPPEASSPPDGITRRTMLQLVGSSLSLAGLAACRRPVEHIVPYVEPPETVIPGIPRVYATTMPIGTSAFGVVVESHEGRPTKIEGNELHPATRGASSVRLQAAILELYDPDRSRDVLREGKRSSWADFRTAWEEIRTAHEATGGKGLAFVSRPWASPTLARQVAELRDRFPEAHWAVWEPVSDENLRRGTERVTGEPWTPVAHLDRARVIVSIDADLFVGEAESVRHARGFADGRRVTSEADGMNRLYVVESVFTATGASADHRIRLRSGQMGAFVLALARELSAQGLPVGPGTVGGTAEELGVDPRVVRAMARDLRENAGRGLVVAGAHQPAEVHAAVLALNAALGNLGATLTLHPAPDTARSDVASLVSLVGEMKAGKVSSLVIVGGNPVYDAPADVGFAEALAEVEHTVHLAGSVDETSALCGWHLPEAHFLEAWGDARSVEGTPGVVQPLIQPLFVGRSAIEVLHLLATGEETAGYDLVRKTWKEVLPADGFDAAWNRMLHDGLREEGSGASPRAEIDAATRGALFGELTRATKTGSDGLEIAFRPSAAVYDGRGANNSWLQELPDPVTKIVWDNAATLSVATADSLGVGNGDVVTLRLGERSIEAPVFVVPGQADSVVGVSLGYGRTKAGRVGNGIGFDAYRLRTADALGQAADLVVEPTGRKAKLVSTQAHWEMEGRPLALEATLATYRKDPDFVEKSLTKHPPLQNLWDEHTYDQGYQWGMTIDLNACIGCNACMVACQAENNVPVVGKDQVSRGREMHWIRIDRYFSGDAEAPGMIFQPVPCMHCENAPCEQVCPVAATVHDGEGLNTMVYNRCIGTRYCSNNCPYKVRRFNFYNLTKATPELQQMAHNPDVTVRSRGVMEKCTYCTQRINAAKIDARLEDRKLRDGEVVTACQQACPTRAIEFGDLRDETSRVHTAKRQKRSYDMLAELNTRPRTSYQARLRNPNPDLA